MLLLTTLLFFSSPRSMRADTPADEPEQDQRLLEKWHEDPALYARLKRDLETFLTLPTERQERMRKLDLALREEDSATSVRLSRVMERYSQWLGHLPEGDRRRIEASRDANERLQIVKELREREWIEHLPRATREELAKLTPDQQRTRMTELRKEERAFRESCKCSSSEYPARCVAKRGEFQQRSWR